MKRAFRDSAARTGVRFLAGSALVLIFAASGCGTSMVITPQVASRETAGFRIGGKILYDGNREYLPRTIAEEGAGEPALSFRYAYQCTYGRDNTPQALPLFNPFSLVGFPIGADTLVVAGKLDVLNGNTPVKSYTAACAMDKARNLFSEGETYSELRKKGLIAVRNNIEAQMFEDRDFFANTIAGQ